MTIDINFPLGVAGNFNFSKSAVARMSSELKVLNYIKATDEMLTNTNSTLCWDASSLDDHHINGVYVQV